MGSSHTLQQAYLYEAFSVTLGEIQCVHSSLQLQCACPFGVHA